MAHLVRRARAATPHPAPPRPSSLGRVWLRVMTTAVVTCTATSAPAASFVRMDFNLTLVNRARGTVFIELFDDRPITRDNFLQYVNGGHYDGMLMHRMVRSFVLQGGGFYPALQNEPPPLNASLNPNARVDLDGNPATPNPTIQNEFSNSPIRSNTRGTLAMAKSPGDPNSASSQFFFNLNNNGGSPPNGLDYQNGGFTVFGQVVGDGMTSLIDVYNTLPIENLNPDDNNDLVRDAGPFGETPIYVSSGSFIVLVVEDAEQIDYLGSGTTTNIPTGGLTITARDAFIDTGANFTGTGPLIVEAGRTLGIREGTTLTRTLVNRGNLAPGLQLGSITVGTYEQPINGTLEIQLRQTTADTEHDRLIVTNTAFLSGKLDVSLLGGFVPKPGDTFGIINAGAIVGDFTSADLPMLNAGLVWDLSRTLTAYTLAIAAADFNRDGMVDAADYVVWRKTRNTTVTAYSGADGNGDGVVNDADFLIWRANVGNIRGTAMNAGASSLAAAALPEPSAALLVLLALSGLANRSARRCAFRESQ